MAACQNHRFAGKPSYNLRKNVEIQDDGAFLNEFSSQPIADQSGSKSDTDSDIEFDIDAVIVGSSSASDQNSVVSKLSLDVRGSEKAPGIECLSDPTHLDKALINAKILSQLDTIGKRLSATEINLASVSRPQAVVSSNFTTSHGAENLQKRLPDLHTVRHNKVHIGPNRELL